MYDDDVGRNGIPTPHEQFVLLGVSSFRRGGCHKDFSSSSFCSSSNGTAYRFSAEVVRTGTRIPNVLHFRMSRYRSTAAVGCEKSKSLLDGWRNRYEAYVRSVFGTKRPVQAFRPAQSAIAMCQSVVAAEEGAQMYRILLQMHLKIKWTA